MAAMNNMTGTPQITVNVKEVDFVTRFNDNWDALVEILGIMNPVRKAPGTTLVASRATVTLQDGDVAEGDEVPLSQAKVTPVVFEEITLRKYRKAVSAEAVAKFGAATAVQKTDDAFLNELQGEVMDEFYDFVQTGTLTGNEATFQMAVAMAVGKAKNKFKTLRLNHGNVVAFVNDLDAARYLGGVQITVQTKNGIEYLKDFLGAQTIIITAEVPEGKVIATAADNLVLYYIDPADGDFKELGLEYYTGNGDTSLIGVHKEGNYGRVMGETHALMGMKLFAEYIDAIAVITIEAA